MLNRNYLRIESSFLDVIVIDLHYVFWLFGVFCLGFFYYFSIFKKNLVGAFAIGRCQDRALA